MELTLIARRELRPELTGPLIESFNGRLRDGFLNGQIFNTPLEVCPGRTNRRRPNRPPLDLLTRAA